MPSPSSDQVLIFVYFIYGMAFFGMGLTMALELERLPSLSEARLLRPLAAFGMIHGTHEWLESYLRLAEIGNVSLPDWLPWLRLGLLLSSFIALIVYGASTLLHRPLTPKIHLFLGLSLLGLFLLAILVSAARTYFAHGTPSVDFLDSLIRYLLAVPGAALAAMALRAEALDAFRLLRPRLGKYLTWASIAFGVYALSQIVVARSSLFPARIINVDSFRATLGFPIQVIRTLAAVVITLSLLRSTQFMEKLRQQQLTATQTERLQALEAIQVELTKREALRRELLQHTVRAQEEERARIAREIHDETSQVLTAFSLDLATLGQAVSKRSVAKDLVDRLQGLSRQMSKSLYHLVSDLRPAQLDDLGLVPTLEYLRENFRSKGLEITLRVEGRSRRLDSVVETVLFRVAQEAVTNVLRHAHSDQAQMVLVFQPQIITLRISDAGQGFNPEETFVPPRGWGMAGMRERVEIVGGELRITSRPGKGTTVEAVIPMGLKAPEGRQG